MPLNIRSSDLLDKVALLDWMKEKETAFNLTTQGEEETGWWLDYVFSFIPYGGCLTVCQEEKVIAIGTLFLPPYHKLKHHCAFSLVVDPSYRRQGVGSLLLQELIGLAKKRFKIEVLSLETILPSSLVPFIEKNGFKEFARLENWFKMSEKSYPKVCYEKEL